MIAYLRRALLAVLDIVSPSVVASVRRRDPEPRSWIARRERALALLWLGDRPSLAEQAEEDIAATANYAEAVIREASKEAR